MIDFRTALVTDPLVSVVVPTYRHARFIAKCLDSILMQQCDFEWELIIGEDGSDDGTKEICTRYAEEHPDRIRLMHRDRRDVIHVMGRATGRSNVIKLYEEARGKYIAICEGDDLWIEPMKLQRQVDALEARPDAMGCFTNVYNDREGDRVPYFAPGPVSEPPAEVDQLAVLLGQAIPTCSFIFRRAELPSIPPEFYKAPVADTLLFAHVSRHGPLLYLPVLAGVRHVHPGGINSMKSRAHKMKVMLHAFPYLDGISGKRFSKELSDRRRKELLMHWDRAMREGDLEMARVCWRPLAEMRGQIGWNLTTTIRNYLKAWHPAWDRMVARLRGS